MRASHPTSAVRAWWSGPLGGALAIVAAVWLAWSNTWSAPFEFDDHASIIDNRSIRQLGSTDWMHPPATAGETVSGRPVLNFTFAVNYALGGLDVRGYHAVNLLIHALAALTLFGVVRRTFVLMRPTAIPDDTAWAAGVALLWAVHPLQTESVTYVVQRAESLGGLWCLLTLYAFIRGAACPHEHAWRWFWLAIGSCLLGVGTKETVVVMPLIVLLWDRTFAAGSLAAAWRAHGRVHAALFATWLPLAALVWENHGRGGSAGTAVIGAGTYFLTQCEALVRYLGLVFWPVGQVFDYGTAVAPGFGAVGPQFLLLTALAGGTFWLLARNRPAGLAGAACFLLLAPSSSLVPVATQTLAEHRMYLPLAAVIVLVCAIAGAHLPRRWGLGLVLLAAFALGGATVARNQVYRSALALWTDTVARRPGNPRAHYNLGLALDAEGREGEAATEFERTLALQPNHAFAHFALGKAALLAGRWPEAVARFESAVQIDPTYVNARVNLGQVLVRSGRAAEAIGQYQQALAVEPGADDIRVLLAAAHRILGQSQASDDPVAAEASLRESLRLDETPAGGWFVLGNVLARQQRFHDAIAAYQAALTREPGQLDAKSNLANCLLFTRQFDEAIANYEAVLQARPNDVRIQENLRLAREAKAQRQ